MSEITKIKVDGEPESSYQLYPRNEEFAKRSEGVQPDWNQNDDTKPGYVKNRPFYTGDPTEDVLFNGSFVFTIIGMGPMGEKGVYNGATDFSPEIGQTYQVSWDGAVYSCVGTEYNSLIALGNLSIMNFGSDTGEPFLMTFGTGSINIYTHPVGSSHTISIGKMVAPVVKIDPKYLPDNPLNITGATVGQIAKITAVDESGKPTAWETVDMSGGGGGVEITTLHINVTAVNKETMEATFTADKTPLEMQQASTIGPTWCVVTIAAGLMGEEAVSIGVPPAWYAGNVAFGSLTANTHNDNGNNKTGYVVRSVGSDRWVFDATQLGG